MAACCLGAQFSHTQCQPHLYEATGYSFKYISGDPAIDWRDPYIARAVGFAVHKLPSKVADVRSDIAFNGSI